MDTTTTLRMRSGTEHPVLGLGTWQLTHETAETVEEALRLGYRLIDTSGDYGTQPGVGEAVRGDGVERGDVFLVTKVEEDEDSYQAVRRNLGELGLDRADLMLIHRPPPGGAGVDLWEGLIRARDEGLTREIGVSNYSVDQIEEVSRSTGEVPAVNQIEWSPFGWSREMLDHCREHDILIQAYSPLTRGERLDDERLTAIASGHGRTPAQVLLRWNLELGTVPLPKANRRDHLAENLDALDFELDEADVRRLNGMNESWSALGPTLQYI